MKNSTNSRKKNSESALARLIKARKRVGTCIRCAAKLKIGSASALVMCVIFERAKKHHVRVCSYARARAHSAVIAVFAGPDKQALSLSRLSPTTEFYYARYFSHTVAERRLSHAVSLRAALLSPSLFFALFFSFEFHLIFYIIDVDSLYGELLN